MIEIRLPRLVGSRHSAVLLTREHEVAGQPVAVVCRDLRSGTESFADEMVRVLLVERGAAEVVLVGAPSLFERYVREQAALHGVADRVRVGTAADFA